MRAIDIDSMLCANFSVSNLPRDNSMKTKLVCILLAAGSVFGASTTASAFLRVSCDDFNDSDASMWVRYIDSGERRTLDVMLKMPVNDKTRASPTRSVLLGTRNIGQITLTPNGEGMLSGSLSYDSYAASGGSNPGVSAFPGGWTGAVSGNLVRTSGLSCELRG
jgi:hypothetical protein